MSFRDLTSEEQERFNGAVSAELLRLTLGGKPDRPELQDFTTDGIDEFEEPKA